MRKFTAILCTMFFISSMAGCTGRGTNQGTQNQNNSRTDTGMYNTGTNNRTSTADNSQGARTGYNTNQGNVQGPGTGTASGAATGTYKDGTYTAYGDNTPVGNHVATVYIKDGRISNVTLDYADKRGNITTGNNMSANVGNTTGSMQYGGTTGNGNTTVGMNNTATGGNTSGTYHSSGSDGRAAMASYIVQNQTYEVNVPGQGSVALNNWKLAVRRALDQAKK